MKDVLEKLNKAQCLTHIICEYCKAHPEIEEVYCLSFLADIIFEILDSVNYDLKELSC